MAAPRRSSYLPTLDGWRAIAILLVMSDHVKALQPGRSSPAYVPGLGRFGVEIFFAISGLLICSRLLDEEEKTGKIGLKPFYIRRFFRIQPAALLYLLAVLVLTSFTACPPSPPGWSPHFCWSATLSASPTRTP